MCGIFGYVTNKETELGPILIAAAERLTYRGYDSVGAATLNNGKIDLRKDTGKVDTVAAKYNIAEMRGQRGITQLRWATFGEPSQVNSQPHLDSDGDMVGAHNGNVVNNVELREQFIAEGMTVRSQNDGETCVHAVERYINRGYEFIDAIRLAYGDLEGDYAFVIGRANDDKLYAFKKGSGMVVGLGSGSTARFALERIGELVRSGELTDIVGVPTSRTVETEARRLDIPLCEDDDPPTIDLTIDGADEVDPAMNLIKGGGGALVREKLVAQLSRREMIIVDETKLSPRLGTRSAVPVEVIAFGWKAQRSFLENLGARVTLRQAMAKSPNSEWYWFSRSKRSGEQLDETRLIEQFSRQHRSRQAIANGAARITDSDPHREVRTRLVH